MLINYIFSSAGCSLLRAVKAFPVACMSFLIKKISAVFFSLSFFGSLKLWIRIHNTAVGVPRVRCAVDAFNVDNTGCAYGTGGVFFVLF
jgi:hypothetical protein